MNTQNIDIFEAIKQNNIKMVKSFLKNGTNPNMRNYYGFTPLCVACERSKFKIVKLLLEHGADPNIQDTHQLNTSLHFASSCGNFKIVKLLLENGADPNIQDCGWTPLIKASYRNDHDIIMILIDHGADCNVINYEGSTVFDYEGGNFIREYLESKEHLIILK